MKFPNILKYNLNCGLCNDAISIHGIWYIISFFVRQSISIRIELYLSLIDKPMTKSGVTSIQKRENNWEGFNKPLY